MDEELLRYVAARSDAEPEGLHELWRHANTSLLYPRMCSGHLQGRLLRMLAMMVSPRHALELGSYCGYSTICLAQGLERPGARLTTIEIDDEMEDLIRSQLAKNGVAQKVDLIIGDAMDVLPSLDLSATDLVYIDANKRRYADYYEEMVPRLPSGAVILADNTLWDGKVTDPAAHDAQTIGMRHFNDIVAADTRVSRVMLPLRDGLTIIRKI